MALVRHASEGWNPVMHLICEGKIKNWTPAFAGVTTGRVNGAGVTALA
jgi:hypothetical protein